MTDKNDRTEQVEYLMQELKIPRSEAYRLLDEMEEQA